LEGWYYPLFVGYMADSYIDDDQLQAQGVQKLDGAGYPADKSLSSEYVLGNPIAISTG